VSSRAGDALPVVRGSTPRAELTETHEALVAELLGVRPLDDVEQAARVLGAVAQRRAREADDHRVLGGAQHLPQVAQQLHAPRVAQDVVGRLHQVVYFVHEHDLVRERVEPVLLVVKVGVSVPDFVHALSERPALACSRVAAVVAVGAPGG
jgi:hypothetical protein